MILWDNIPILQIRRLKFIWLITLSEISWLRRLKEPVCLLRWYCFASIIRPPTIQGRNVLYFPKGTQAEADVDLCHVTERCLALLGDWSRRFLGLLPTLRFCEPKCCGSCPWRYSWVLPWCVRRGHADKSYEHGVWHQMLTPLMADLRS